MTHWRIGTAIVLTFLFAVTTARAGDTGTGLSTGLVSVVQPPHQFRALTQAFGGAAGGIPPGGSGLIGMGGACGHIGFAGMSGCYGGSFGSHMVGMCGFGGCFGGPYPYCMGSLSGCFGGWPWATQSYTRWTPSANKAYYFRVLSVQTPPPNDLSFEFVLVHYPDRPKFFFYFDPVEKKYVGRYRLGAKAEESFQLVNPPARKLSLKDIPESAFRNVGGMPPISYLIQPKLAASADAATLKTIKLLRPPDSIPDELLGLPPEEPALKKPPDKK